MRVAVAGNPNSGKSTLFNAITGANARVGNYAGVTVERKEADTLLPSGRRARLVDLPGCYSLTARSREEEIAHQVLVGRAGGERPALVVCVADATNLPRALYLVLQLLELELPVVVALNMIDVAERRGLRIDADKLSRRLGVPVLPTSARYGTGLADLRRAVEDALSETGAAREPRLDLSAEDHAAVARLKESLRARGDERSPAEAVWLLTSNLDDLGIEVAPGLAELVHEARRGLDPEGSGAFNRRVIEARYRSVDQLLEGVVDAGAAVDDALTRKLDGVLLHPVLGFVAFALAMLLVFQTIFAWATPFMDAIELGMSGLASLAEQLIPEGLTRSLVVNGVLAGVGSILVFLPQIALLFLLLTLLEESGYMARAAFLLDRVMRSAGLNGKAFVPLMSGFACAVPAVMAARTIESYRDRLTTILVTPFMSCSARLPVYVLVVAAVFSGSAPIFGVLSVGALVIAAMYALGVAAAIGTAFVLKRTALKAPPPPFIMELPPYKLPTLRVVVRTLASRCGVFVTQTGSVILALSMLLWGLLTFPSTGLPDSEREARLTAIAAMPAEAQAAAQTALVRDHEARRLEESFAGRIGHAIEPLIEPLGFDWRIGIGLVASFAAREVLVSTLGQVYALGADVEPESKALRGALLADRDPVTNKPRFTPLVGVSLMVFFVLAMQCLSTVATVRRETQSWRWPIAQLVAMNAMAYVASLLVFQVGRALGLG